MRLQKLSCFMESCLVGPNKPTVRTVRKWPGAIKIAGEWYIDLDVWESHTISGGLVEALMQDPEVAALVGKV